MTPEILEKLHTALYSVSPLASDREKIIADMGETIWVETLEKILTALPESERTSAVAFLNAGDTDKAVEIFEVNNVDLDTIITEVATSVMDQVVSGAATA